MDHSGARVGMLVNFTAADGGDVGDLAYDGALVAAPYVRPGCGELFEIINSQAGRRVSAQSEAVAGEHVLGFAAEVRGFSEAQYETDVIAFRDFGCGWLAETIAQ